MGIKNNKITKGSGDNKTSGLPAESEVPQGMFGAQNFRTLQGDMVNAVKKQDRSLAQMIIADKKRKRASGYRDKKVLIETKHSNNVYKIFFGFIVIVIIASLGLKLVWQEKENTENPPRKQISTAIIPINEQIVLNIKNFAANQTFVAVKNNALAKNKTESDGILHLRFIKEIDIADEKTSKVKKTNVTLPVDEFFELWENGAPESLIRSFKKENYVFGFYNTGKEMLPFLLLELKSFDQAFAGALMWENVLCKNMQSIFQTENECPQYKFKNAQLLDTDIRVLEIESGKPAILYGFLNDEDVLIITQSTAVFKEINSLFY